ncbi:MAG: hypothetical protein V2G48_06860 [bacterium JZ-2024 1]
MKEKDDKEKWWEHLQKGLEGMMEEFREKIPGEFVQHMKNSLKESLLAFRALMDYGIEKIEKSGEKSRVKKIEVK